MVSFNEKYWDEFLGVTRKYMQVRGNLSQKDLSEKIAVGISTMSRFLSKKVRDIDPQLVARVVAYLNIPLHEVIDFVAEASTEEFKNLIQFYKDNPPVMGPGEASAEDREPEPAPQSSGQTRSSFQPGARENQGPFKGTSLRDKLEQLTPRQKSYLSDFLDLDVEGKDLVVDLGNSLFRYFRQKGVEF